jgi:hypothetical protein
MCSLENLFSLHWSESILCGSLSYKHLATLWPGLIHRTSESLSYPANSFK